MTSQPKTRNTWQKQAIQEFLSATDDFVSAQDIHQGLLRQDQKVSLATVYRVLQAQVEAGTVDLLTSDDGESFYRHCTSPQHHHHVVCTRCKATEEFEAPELEQVADETARRFGYLPQDHTLEIFGLCPNCQRDQLAGRENLTNESVPET
ncbi:Fur family transcriptional regulator [Auritidibacter ignavus]|uniref:Fur family transcriptional regulator n=1 Tax=Auritidibacter ignavus TaxID=678932 RepID=UPI0024B9DC7C|nr:Fur family transcriptional regulator [Auritidibacter ignavus]WHS28291.1 Fur family transcriptional regulator [Auritidibacter ignavus]